MTNKEHQLVVGKDELVTNHFNSIIPELEREASHLGRSLVDVGVWLVGLSTGVLAVLLSSTTASETLTDWAYKGGVLAFSIVVLLGVVQRVLFHFAELLRFPISIRLRSSMIALTDRTPLARELQDYWTIDDIVERLRLDFGVDYSYLIEYKVSLDRAREAYSGQLEIQREFEGEGLSHLAKIICVHFGMPAESQESYFEPSSDEDLEKTRSEARRANLVYRLADLAYFGSALTFAGGIGTLAIGAI